MNVILNFRCENSRDDEVYLVNTDKLEPRFKQPVEAQAKPRKRNRVVAQGCDFAWDMRDNARKAELKLPARIEALITVWDE